MKIYKSNYRHHWISPYIILEKVFFWREIDYDEPIIEKWSNRLLPFSEAYQAVMDFIHPKIDYVKIDRWDTWSMDHTLADIILPMLKQLKADKHGSPNVADEDVPMELQSWTSPAKDEYDVDGHHFARWDYVLNEMIFAFECKNDDEWDKQFWSGVSKTEMVESNLTHFNPVTQQHEKTYEMVEHGDIKCDWEGRKKMQERISNGFRLFGRYYEALWD